MRSLLNRLMPKRDNQRAHERLISNSLACIRREHESRELGARAPQQRAIAIKVLEAIVSECKKYFVESCQITLSSSVSKYSFKTVDGRLASGTVDARINLALSSLLREQTTLPFQIEPMQTAPGEFSLSWHNFQIDNVIPLVRALNSGSPQQASSQNLPSTQLPYLDCVARPQDTAAVSRSTRQVMIVEDNPTFTRVLERFLQRIDVQTSAFASVEDALIALDNHGIVPQVIVADLHLPGKGGDDLIAAVRAHRYLQHVGIIVLTSDDSCDAELKTIQLGADAFIGKNQDPRILCAHVERILSKQADQRAA